MDEIYLNFDKYKSSHFNQKCSIGSSEYINILKKVLEENSVNGMALAHTPSINQIYIIGIINVKLGECTLVKAKETNM